MVLIVGTNLDWKSTYFQLDTYLTSLLVLYKHMLDTF